MKVLMVMEGNDCALQIEPEDEEGRALLAAYGVRGTVQGEAWNYVRSVERISGADLRELRGRTCRTRLKALSHKIPTAVKMDE